MDIDKIPIDLLVHSPGDETYRLGTLELTKAEYANAEKINQVIDELITLSERLTQVEGK